MDTLSNNRDSIFRTLKLILLLVLNSILLFLVFIHKRLTFTFKIYIGSERDKFQRKRYLTQASIYIQRRGKFSVPMHRMIHASYNNRTIEEDCVLSNSTLREVTMTVLHRHGQENNRSDLVYKPTRWWMKFLTSTYLMLFRIPGALS